MKQNTRSKKLKSKNTIQTKQSGERKFERRESERREGRVKVLREACEREREWGSLGRGERGLREREEREITCGASFAIVVQSVMWQVLIDLC